jgi:hypothetical protein
MTTSREEVARILRSQTGAATRDLYFCALLTREVGDREAPTVVVGGSAVEIYTEGQYISGDIDLVGKRTALARILESWGFTRKNREWYSVDWKLAVDLVNDNAGMTGSRTLIRTIVTPYGPVQLAAIEDLILKRLTSAKYWQIPSDREQAAILARRYRDELDRTYLSEGAKRDGVADEWSELERLLYPSDRRGPDRR